MSGKLRAVLDTNAVVALLAGNHSLSQKLEHAEYVGISIITYLEFLAFDGLTETDRACFETFCKRITIESLTIDNSLLLKKTQSLPPETTRCSHRSHSAFPQCHAYYQ